MFDARHSRATKSSNSICAKLFSRKRRQCLDSDALAYGYLPPKHVAKSKYKRTLSTSSMYGHQAAYERPPPAGFYQNDFASESYVSTDPSRRRPHRKTRPSASRSTLDLPPRYTSSPHNEVRPPRTTREYPPEQPPRPASKNVHFGDGSATRGTSQGRAPVDNLASRLGEMWADVDPRVARENANNEALWIEALDRELLLVEEEQLVEHVELQRSVKRDDAPPSKTRTGLINYNKTWAFANSRLPPHQPPFKTYFETWRLICRAARSSAQVYQRPQRDQREHFIAADWRHRTKAMVLKSTPLDDQNLIVFSIRGSQVNFVDWNVNLQPAPTAPEGFLDDGQNACHSGFLKVAKAMVIPVAARLRQLLEQDPSRCSSSLLITGHSAGGAVASLLYMHMLATTVESELNILTGCFKRVHCVTFGAPPVSFLPLQKPRRADKSLFLSFINEGDLIVRADKAYMVSLAKLLAGSKGSSHCSASTLVKKASHAVLKSSKEDKGNRRAPYWPVPEAPLSNAGRLVVLREKPGSKRNPSIEAVVTDDGKLRDVIFGDTSMHAMSLYQQRVEALAFAAMLGEDGG
jgi:hypothetical protein